MASEYYYLNHYSNRGKMGIARKAFTQIATIATNQVQNASVASRNKKFLFHLDRPVSVVFRKDGKVEIKLDVSIKRGVPVKDVCADIQNHVADAILMMCETVPFSIEIKVSALH
ncbi:MAG: Asp23/Gls24 family envelope stress response protein [Erysipelotrichaceae bacterium]|nr:Asp23/Gls24 family envelope stress response protein [Erysipelotrichaceae bacterium]